MEYWYFSRSTFHFSMQNDHTLCHDISYWSFQGSLSPLYLFVFVSSVFLSVIHCLLWQGYIHTSWDQTSAASGRLQSANPVSSYVFCLEKFCTTCISTAIAWLVGISFKDWYTRSSLHHSNSEHVIFESLKLPNEMIR